MKGNLPRNVIEELEVWRKELIQDNEFTPRLCSEPDTRNVRLFQSPG